MVPRLTNYLTTQNASECLIETSNFENETVKKLVAQDDILAKIFDVKKVKNNFLEALFLLKKAEINIRHGQVSEQYMIHVTGAAKVNSIISNNFDWRRVTRSKYGKGTSFSKDAMYANCLANWNAGCNRALIISRVIVSKIGQGFKDQLVPRQEFDTSVGNKGKVFVKFYDNEMLPTYVAFFCDTSFDRVNRPNLNIPVQPLSVLKNKSDRSRNSTPVRNQRLPKKPLHSESSEIQIGLSQMKQRLSLENPAKNTTRFEETFETNSNKRYIRGQNTEYPIIKHPTVTSQKSNFSRSTYPANQRPHSVQRQTDWDEIYSPSISQTNTTVQYRLGDSMGNRNKSTNKSSKSCGFISGCKSVAEFIFCCCTRQA